MQQRTGNGLRSMWIERPQWEESKLKMQTNNLKKQAERRNPEQVGLTENARKKDFMTFPILCTTSEQSSTFHNDENGEDEEIR